MNKHLLDCELAARRRVAPALCRSASRKEFYLPTVLAPFSAVGSSITPQTVRAGL
jgi:hypothetical protein